MTLEQKIIIGLLSAFIIVSYNDFVDYVGRFSTTAAGLLSIHTFSNWSADYYEGKVDVFKIGMSKEEVWGEILKTKTDKLFVSEVFFPQYSKVRLNVRSLHGQAISDDLKWDFLRKQNYWPLYVNNIYERVHLQFCDDHLISIRRSKFYIQK